MEEASVLLVRQYNIMQSYFTFDRASICS